jgi:RimJ/RimL family protein N-acetyltransferase
MPVPRLRAEWSSAVPGARALVAIEPTDAELAARAPDLAAAYNDPYNSAMMANSIAFTADDVRLHYAAMAAKGARQFFLYEGDVFVGDADFRSLAQGTAEFAILVLARERQGRGLGTGLALLLHALAFRALDLERLYVTILPQNAASRRVFAKVGYAVDTSPAARAYVDEELDVSMSLARHDFERSHADVLADVRITAA